MCLESRTSELEDASLSPHELALLRIDSLHSKRDFIGENIMRKIIGFTGGLANELNGILHEALLASVTDLPVLLKALKIIENITVTDPTLLEEIDTSEGFRDCLQKILHLQEGGEDENELLKSIQSIAMKIENSCSKLETLDKVVPFTESQLKARLPLIFDVPGNNTPRRDLKVMIHQVTSEEETETHDTGYVMWPASVILARYLAENPSLFLGTANNEIGDILELGAGCGLVGLVVATLLRQHKKEQRVGCEETKDGFDHDSSVSNTSVIFTDYLPAILDNIERNIWLNDIDKSSVRVAGLDFFDQPGNDDSKYDGSEQNWIDMEGAKQPQVSLVLGADILPYSNDAVNVANTIFAALVEGGKAFVISPRENKRYGVYDFPKACRNAGMDVSIITCAKSAGSKYSSGEEIMVENTSEEELDHFIGNYDVEFFIFKIEKPLTS
ncbi:unnamed protein product [Pseudo-nitzschia multistriata]|uniref:FAM86 N-terminal domain-containing protein n=1 Tax=Pseudo-nitzschia multistriata TaxID=183589 RepID=A0A448ZDC2_9STRA|nr:unnamed protein product [Pseudo-nitzschia multistriata]